MINKIWSFLIIVGILFSISIGKIDVVNKTMLESTKTTLDMIFNIFPVMALWLGIMNIAKKAKLLDKLALILSPIFKKIFPSVPSGHESLGYITSNIVTSMFGLGNAATPFGLKAMKSLQEINNNKDTASDAMITFLVINTSGFTIIPTTVISLRMLYNSSSPTSIIVWCIIVSSVSLIVGIIIDYIFRRIYGRNNI